MDQWLDIAGRVVIVTGASSGIGRSIAVGLAGLGAKVMDLDLRAPAEMAVFDGYVGCDITDPAAVDQAVGQVFSRHGRIDALINNAGINRPRLLVDPVHPRSGYELTKKDYDAMMDVDVLGAVLMTQAAARYMVQAGCGVVVNVSSTSGQPGSVGQCVYAAAKAAVNSLTRSLAKELGPHGIRVVAIAPGIHEKTHLNSCDEYLDALAYTRGVSRQDIDAGYAGAIPLRRVGRLDELADAVCYLISDRASYITGTVINVSGGKTTD